MRYLILAVGEAKPGPELALFRQYAERLRPPPALVEIEPRRKPAGPALQEAEAAALRAALARAPARRRAVIALDERGLSLTSRAFADRLQGFADSGAGTAVFLIGGAEGLAPDLRAEADLVLSLGAMTWPHLLARALLAEQLYRAQTLRAGHPYHRG